MVKHPNNPIFFKIFLLSLNGDEKINGINPKLMKDIINYRHLLDESNGIEKFSEKIGKRRWEHLLKLDLSECDISCRYQLKFIRLVLEKEIANAKLEAYQNPFSGAYHKIKILQDIGREIGWEL